MTKTWYKVDCSVEGTDIKVTSKEGEPIDFAEIKVFGTEVPPLTPKDIDTTHGA